MNANGQPTKSDTNVPADIPLSPGDNASVSIALANKSHPSPTAPLASPSSAANSDDNSRPSNPKPIIYTRKQLLHLSNSPLVAPPLAMPLFKDWFGDWDAQAIHLKKDGESHLRDRRFKRESDDPEAGTKPSFRSAVASTQPSQMGNFKHTSTRVTSVSERADREHDSERELRDRDGHERLRNLSEKFDRERLAMAGSAVIRREKEKENGSINSRTVASARSEKKDRDSGGIRARDVDSRRADNTDDWRDIRSRPERKGRYSERAKQDPPDKDTRGRQDSSLEDSHTHDRSRSREPGELGLPLSGNDPSELRPRRTLQSKSGRRHDESNEDDTRKWKEENVWEERKAARDTKERERHGGKDAEKDTGDNSRRAGPRNRKVSALEDEREPAWMNSYDPDSDGKPLGILGGQAEDGKLDDIQAWKKELKERELREKNASKPQESETVRETVPAIAEDSALQTLPSALDEISMFKMMMEKEQGKQTSSETPTIDPTSNQFLPLGDILQSTGVVQHNISLDSPLDEIVPQGSHLNGLRLARPTSSAFSSAEVGGTPGHSDAVQQPTQSLDYDPPKQSRILSFGLPRASPIVGAPASSPFDPLQNRAGQNSNPQNTFPNFPSNRPAFTDPSLSGVPSRPSPTPSELRRLSGNFNNALTLGELHKDPFSESRSSPSLLSPSSDGPSTVGSGAKGSRFAKFFDSKTRDPPNVPSVNFNGMGLSPVSSEAYPHMPSQRGPPVDQRYLQMRSGGTPPSADHKAFESLLSMLHNSSRNILQPEIMGRSAHPNMNSVNENNLIHTSRSVSGNPNPIPQSSRPQNYPHYGEFQTQAIQTTGFDGRFGSDPMVADHPGSMRSRQTSQSTFGESIEEHNLLNAQRPVHQRFSGHDSALRGYRTSSPESVRLMGPNSQAFLEGGRPVIQQQQRLPPGLANLGGRPPYDGTQMGHGVHTLLQGQGQHHQSQIPVHHEVFSGRSLNARAQPQAMGPFGATPSNTLFDTSLESNRIAQSSSVSSFQLPNRTASSGGMPISRQQYQQQQQQELELLLTGQSRVMPNQLQQQHQQQLQQQQLQLLGQYGGGSNMQIPSNSDLMALLLGDNVRNDRR